MLKRLEALWIDIAHLLALTETSHATASATNEHPLASPVAHRQKTHTRFGATATKAEKHNDKDTVTLQTLARRSTQNRIIVS